MWGADYIAITAINCCLFCSSLYFGFMCWVSWGGGGFQMISKCFYCFVSSLFIDILFLSFFEYFCRLSLVDL
jgi:hypothetical protein